MLALQVEHLTYRYRTRDQAALRECTFCAHAGQIILVAGASGCGKTTLMRCINGLIPRSYTGGDLSGAIRILGRDPTNLRLAEISRMVGTVLQDPEKQIVGSYVLTEVAFGLENLGLPREEILARVDQTLAFLGISHLRERETTALSGGEKQKVAIAGVLAMEPDIVLLDEPLASLDPVSARETLRLVRRLADAGKSVLLIEHRVEDVLGILRADDAALFLEEGEQLYFGDVPGFLQVARPGDVKLPAPLALAKLKSTDGIAGQVPAVLPPRPVADHSAPPLIEFKGVNFGYDSERPVLHDITLAVYPGDVIAVLGPNGAGKSTLVKHAIRLLHPASGTVHIEGRPTTRLTTAQTARTVGYVFQSPTHMLFAPTVREELAFGPRNLGFPPDVIARNVRASLEIVDLVGYEERAPLALSFGQQRRVGIAAILAMQSKVLAMDEPTAGQDLKHYTQFMDAIMGMPFRAILFITHDVDLAVRYANRVLLVAEGRILADGPPEEVLADRPRLERARVVSTSLLELNLGLLPRTGRFARVEALIDLVDLPVQP